MRFSPNGTAPCHQPNESEAPTGRPSFGHHQSFGGCPRIECSAAPLGLCWVVATVTQADGLGWHRAATLWRKTEGEQSPASNERGTER